MLFTVNVEEIFKMIVSYLGKGKGFKGGEISILHSDRKMLALAHRDKFI